MHTLIEALFSLAMFFNAILFIPQAYKIYREKAAKDVSLLTFAGFNLIQIITVIHGYINNDWYLTIGMGVSFLTCLLVTIFIMYYRSRGWILSFFRK